MLTFKDLENAVCGETVLVDSHGRERLFMGIMDSHLITYSKEFRSASEWKESEIENWSIKKKTKKVKMWKWLYIEECGRVYDTMQYYQSSSHIDFDKRCKPLQRLDYTEIEVELGDE